MNGMRLRSLFFACLLAGFLSFHLSGFAQDIHFNLVTRTKEDIGSQVSGMTQDKQGFLWFATPNGLYKYDGYQSIPYHHEPLNTNSPAEDNIYEVLADNAGYLWI